MTYQGPVYAVFRAALNFASRPDTEERLKRDGQDAYEMRIIGAQMAVATTFEEIEHLLNLMARAHTFQEVRSLLKLYLISWATLSDVIAVLINHVYDLGYAAPDVSFGAILRNSHIQRTRIPAIVKKHSASVRHDHYMKLRNDVIHRGTLTDTEFDELQGEWLAAATIRFVRAAPADAAAEDSELRDAAATFGIHAKLEALIASKRQQLADHLGATRILLEEFSDELAAEIERRRAA